MQTKQALPPVEQVVPGLWSVPVPIPGSPLPYVLAYAFEVPDGVVLVDPGWNAAEALAALEEGLGSFGAKLEDVRGVLVTHLHPDHYGLAGRVREVSGAWVGLHPADAALIPDRYEDVDDLLEQISGWLAQTGAPPGDDPRAHRREAEQSGAVLVRRAVPARRGGGHAALPVRDRDRR